MLFVAEATAKATELAQLRSECELVTARYTLLRAFVTFGIVATKPCVASGVENLRQRTNTLGKKTDY